MMLSKADTAITFQVDGPLVGAVRTTQRAKWVSKPYQRYRAFKDRVRLLATVAGVPPSLDPKDGVKVRLHASWRLRQRIDLDNVIKAILDSLWLNDRRVVEIQATSAEHTGKETVQVWVEHLDRT
jgi:Holliday junction resolvase RusA-like endonuclease